MPRGKMIRSSLTALEIQGMEVVAARMQKIISKMLYFNKQGMIKAGFLVLRESNLIVPRDLSNLAGSGFVAYGAQTRNQPGKFSSTTDSRVATRLERDHRQVMEFEKGDTMGTITRPKVDVGYTAFYAIYVHERLDVRHREGKTAKFLLIAVTKNEQKILNMIAGETWKGTKI